jgi:hypothetical protein
MPNCGQVDTFELLNTMSLIKYTNDMPEGYYWFRPDRREPNSDEIIAGHPSVIFITGPTTYRRKPCRIVVERGCNNILHELVAAPANDGILWKLEGPIPESSFA